jgi:hypothetical protein
MKPAILILALVYSSGAFAQTAGPPGAPIANSDSSFLIKMTNSMSTISSKPGDLITGVVIDPVPLRGAHVEGTVDRADHSILSFSLHKVLVAGSTYPVKSKLLSVTSSHGNDGQDDLDQRIRIEGGGLIAYGTSTALDEGAEVRFSVWKKQ